MLARGGDVLITADHGNCEQMVDPETGEPHTAHTTNPVPIWWATRARRRPPLRDGGLSDVAPTVLELLGPAGARGDDRQEPDRSEASLTPTSPRGPARDPDAELVARRARAGASARVRGLRPRRGGASLLRGVRAARPRAICRPRPRRSRRGAQPSRYGGAGAEWVRRFKYPVRGLAGLDPAAEAAAFGLVRRLGRVVPGAAPDLVAPVPLHPRRLRERGFSPAAQLARALAREACAPFAPSLLERLRDTRSQTSLSRGDRRRNVAGAFAARGPAPARVWLVDDVATTGSTLAEAAAALRRAGAREIVGVCLAWRPPVG